MPRGSKRLGPAAAAALALCAWAGGTGAEGHAGITVLHVPDVMVASEWIVLTQPAGWRTGDGLMLLIAAGADIDGTRAGFTVALLGQGVAVAELAIAPDLDDPARLAEDSRRVLGALAEQLDPGQLGPGRPAPDVAGSEPALGRSLGEAAIASVAQADLPGLSILSGALPLPDR